MVLPIKTRKFLTERRLPNIEVLLIRFYLPENFKRYEENFVIIGEQECGGYIGIDEADGVYSIEEDVTQMNMLYRFISSSLEQFIEQLTLYQNLSSLWIYSDEEEMEIQAKSFEDSLKEIDEKAVAFEENFWSVIVEQISDGLL